MVEHEYAHRPAEIVGAQEAPETAVAPSAVAAAPVAGIASVAAPELAAASASGADPLGGTRPPDGVVAALRRQRGRGQALPADVAQRFGEQLSTDLGAVRVHTDGAADRLSRSIGARAFTDGNDIYFAQGQFSTGPAGEHLMAHELAHVAQQRSGASAGGAGPVIGRADDPAEADADRQADRVVSALRRQVAGPAAPPAAAETDSAIRRLTVAELRSRHEAFIRAAGGEDAKTTGDESDVEGPENETKTDENGTDVEGPEDETKTDETKTDENETDVEGPENETKTDETKTDENETDVEGPEDEIKTDENESGVEGPEDETKTDETETEDGTDAKGPEGRTERLILLASPELRARIALHRRALEHLAPGLPESVPDELRVKLRAEVLEMLAGDKWVEAMAILDFAEMYLFVRTRLEKLIDSTKPRKKKSDKEQKEGPAVDPAEAAKVDLESGLLQRSADADQTGPVDTSKSTDPDAGVGFETFVVGSGFDLRLASESGDGTGAVELLPTSAIVFTGAISVHDGVIEKMIKTGDGAAPNMAEFTAFLQHLKEEGVSLEFQVEGFAGVSSGTAGQVLDEHLAGEEKSAEEPAFA